MIDELSFSKHCNLFLLQSFKQAHIYITVTIRRAEIDHKDREHHLRIDPTIGKFSTNIGYNLNIIIFLLVIYSLFKPITSNRHNITTPN